MKRFVSFIVSLSFIFMFAVSGYSGDKGNTTNQSFNKAKKILLRQVYYDHPTTFYCGCPFSAKRKILPCDNYTPKRDNKRAHRLEWEHIVPAHALGQSFPEWRNGHPDCVRNNGKTNHLKGEIVPEKWPSHSGTWNPICITWCRRLGR
jgi:deoxyribonuclease I